MRTWSTLHTFALTALTLASLATTVADTTPGRSVPDGRGATVTTTAALAPADAGAPGTAVSAGTRGADPRSRPLTPRPTACLGAVEHVIDVPDGGPPWPGVCITVGGVLRLEGLGPDQLAIHPTDKASCFYAAGVFVCRLVQTGTVTFMITNSAGTRPLTLRVVEATSPPLPSPACLASGTHTIDAANDVLPWSAICVTRDVVLRVENLGPEGFTVDPAGALSCWYEAGVRECRFRQVGTLTVTTTHGDSSPRTLVAVVIR